MTMLSPLRLAALLALATLAGAACGDADGADTADTAVSDTAVADTGGADAADTSAPEDGGADSVDTATPPVDSDGDGLSDEEEATLGTRADLIDTDGDGFGDGWEVAAGSDPLDAKSGPELTAPTGTPYVLDLVDLVEPSGLRTFLPTIISKWPAVLAILDGLGSGATTASDITLTGGIGQLLSVGPDDALGSLDDVFAIQTSSLDPITGAFQLVLAGAIEVGAFETHGDRVTLDLTGISELTRGARLRIDDVTLSGTLTADGEAMTDVELSGVLSRDGVERLLNELDLPIPLEVDQAIALLDSDGDGIIQVIAQMRGRQIVLDGFAARDDAEPVVREELACCPEGLEVGDDIEPALASGPQGAGDDDAVYVDRIIAHALAHPASLDFAATVRVISGERRYYVYSPRGLMYFTRAPSPAGEAPERRFRLFGLASATDLEGAEIAFDDAHNPFRNGDPMALATYEEFLAAGVPFDPPASYLAAGYAEDDERLRYVPSDALPYPYALERLSQLFDDPRAGDVIVVKPSYFGSFGQHGHLGALESRSALIVSGAGVKKLADTPEGDGFRHACLGGGDCSGGGSAFLVRDEAPRIVDVAPTVAKALGVTPITGVGPDGRLHDDNLLAWQDGRPLDAVLDGSTVGHAIILINDGLTSMELRAHTLDPAYTDVDAYRELMARGVTYGGGAITNFPSNTFPSHNVVGSGAWSGHHGLLDNSFYERSVAHVFDPIAQLFETSVFVASASAHLPVETLHEAVIRSFGGAWVKASNPTGVMTASLNDPSSRGAVLATLERRVPNGYVVPAGADSVTVGGVTYTLPEAALTDPEGAVDNATIVNAVGLFRDNVARGVPLPKYAIINLSSTDGAGHAQGPNGNMLRDEVLGRTNARIRVLIELLKEAGIYDDTLIVLTADHGMELKDPNASGDPLAGLPSDLGIVRVGPHVYVKRLDVALTAVSGGYDVVVADHDTGAGVARADVTAVVDGEEVATVETDADGKATITFAATSGQAVELRAQRSGFTLWTKAL
ncbi:MAG: alkaline phosphatase family protein [Myxococcales bacterium]|nr:alkaline phosphatase family protein [Myxococcales bacterium]MCB9735772.1 alkaline phosphatase family protein [Deltaproteobacteria bacterium]